MSLSPNTTHGPYTVLSKIVEGGMGEDLRAAPIAVVVHWANGPKK